MATKEVSWLKIPIVGVPGTECQIQTTDDGRTLDADGEPIPFDERPKQCCGESRWMLGNVFLCQDHAAQTATLMGDDIAEIEKAWRAQL